MGQVIQGRFDSFRPNIVVPPDDALNMHAAHIMATSIIAWAQGMREVATRRPLEPHERKKLLAVAGQAFDHPEHNNG